MLIFDSVELWDLGVSLLMGIWQLHPSTLAMITPAMNSVDTMHYQRFHQAFNCLMTQQTSLNSCKKSLRKNQELKTSLRMGK